ncbi:hypothetical protein BC936DRAFT_143946 [Jimgerdemannia flammicorona]|uniref:Uncharacterized protein n=1 Tax=Jimgerdemannia flammicorona TaxID=994334 RepID=A0A432ZYA4_9FUNG|nr:hypothetical protein BC936DRAFT_143946 [Jimgerdemannia flammicorona]
MLDPDASIYCNNAGVLTLFKKEIAPLQRYTVQTRVLTWDDKWFWLEHRFVYPKDPAAYQRWPTRHHQQADEDTAAAAADKHAEDEIVVACVALSKLVFKERTGKTVPPATVLEICGHGVGDEERERRRAKTFEVVEGLQKTERLFRERWGDDEIRNGAVSLTRAKL